MTPLLPSRCLQTPSERTLVLAALAIAVCLADSSLQSQPQFSVLYNFGSQANDPNQPFYSGIIAQSRDSALYSSTSAGGDTNYNDGAAYKHTTAGSLTTLVNFVQQRI